MNKILYYLHIFFSQMANLFSAEKHLHNARFAKPHELKSILSSTLDGTSLLLGESRFNYVLAVKPTEARGQLGNLGLFVPTGGGKTLFLTTHLLTWPHSAIVNDPKGELFGLTGGYRAKDGLVYVFDPTGYGNCFDPLIGKNTEDDFYAVAKLLLFEPNERDPAFTQRGIKMLTLLLLASRIAGESPFPFISRISKLSFNSAVKRINAISPEIACRLIGSDYSPDKDYEDKKYLADSWESMTSRLYPFLTETVVKSLKGADFNISDLMLGEKPLTIYLKWPESKLLALQPLMKLMWGTFLEELKQVYDNTPDKTKCREVSFPIDEAGITPIPELYKHIATVRSRKMSFLLAYQNLSQVNAYYGEYNGTTILGNMRTQLYYRQTDLKTAKYLVDRLDYKSGFAHSTTDHEGTISKGESEQRIPLLTVQYIMDLMPDEEVIGFYQDTKGMPPFKVCRMDWQRFPVLRQRQRIPPPQLYALPEFENISSSNGHPRKDVVAAVYSGRIHGF